jgi:cell shape-determining protein MreC
MSDEPNRWTGRAVWVRGSLDGVKHRGSVVNTRWLSGESGREVVIIVRGGSIQSVMQSEQGALWDFEPAVRAG